MDYTPKEKETPGYKRVHFFKYFLTETDWNDRHQYHLAKLRLHTSQLHGMGIQDGLTTFRVLQSSPPSLKVEITPGIGTDVQGREILVWGNESMTVDLEKFQLPATVYLKFVYQ